MRFEEITNKTIMDAARIHSESWKESHRSFCSAEFVERHTVEAQAAYLRREQDAGKRVFMLIDDSPVGIVSVHGDLIENLYVLPSRQNQGYGTLLLRFAVRQCSGVPRLWILNINEGARRLYERNGFRETGQRKQLKECLFELEMSESGAKNGTT